MMNQRYQVKGMTCSSCKKRVEESISSLTYITSAIVDLEQSIVMIESREDVQLETLQSKLPSKFTILAEAPKLSRVSSELRKLFPLYLIFGYITITAILLNCNPRDINGFMLDFMGLFYVVFSFFKLLDLKGFLKSFQMYDPLAKKVLTYGWIYPFIEVILGIMLLNRLQIQFALITTIVILGVTTIGVIKTLLNKKSIQCACLGTALKLPMTMATFIENSMMLVMAVTMLLLL